MPVSLNSGFQMPSWFDLLSLDPDGREDEAGIKRAASLVDILVTEELKTGVPADRIMLGGFSQVHNCDSYFTRTCRIIELNRSMQCHLYD